MLYFVEGNTAEIFVPQCLKTNLFKKKQIQVKETSNPSNISDDVRLNIVQNGKQRSINHKKLINLIVLLK